MTPPRRLHEPTGVGVYLRDLQRSVHGTPAEAAAHARRYGVSWVALLAAWEDHRSNAFDLDDYGPAFADQGIDVWVWGYPVAGDEHAFAQRMRQAAEDAHAVGLLLDPEKPYKHRPDAARELVAEVLDVLDEGLGLGVSSYGLPRAHPALPWEAFGGVGWGSPQFYTVSPGVAARGMEQWRELGWTHIVPSLPAFGARAMDRTIEYLDAIGLVPGIAMWSWRQLQMAEWRVLREIAERFRAGCWARRTEKAHAVRRGGRQPACEYQDMDHQDRIAAATHFMEQTLRLREAAKALNRHGSVSADEAMQLLANQISHLNQRLDALEAAVLTALHPTFMEDCVASTKEADPAKAVHLRLVKNPEE